MKLAPARISSFLDSPPRDIRVVLFYGPDTGLVSERAAAMAKKIVPDPNDPFRVARLTVAQVADDSARLADEMSSISFGGGRRLVWIRAATDAVTSSLKSFLDKPDTGDSFLLIEAADLDKRSKLRALCETDAPIVAAIPCYTEEGPQRAATISSLLKEQGFTASRDIIALMSDLLPEDRVALRSEVNKLCLYALGEAEISEEAVRATLQNGAAAEADDLAFAIGAGDAKRACTLIEALFAEQTSPVVLLRSAQRHFTRLHLARGHMETGLSAKEAAGKLQPKLFWKIEAPFIAQLQRWNLPVIESVLTRLSEAEAAVKRTGVPDQALTTQLLLMVAAQAAR